MIEAKPKTTYAPHRDYFPSPLNPWSFIRAMIPIRQTLDDPLVVYQIRRSQGVGRKPWSLLILAYLILIGEIIFLAGLLAFSNLETQRLSVLVGPMLGVLAGGLSLGVVYGHWRLMLAVFMRAARAVTERRQNGDWELIMITPMPKTRWLRAQLIGMGWQVWPLVRNLMIMQGLLVLLFYGLMVYGVSQADDTDYYYQDDSEYLPTPVYIGVVLPIMLGMMIEPILQAGLLGAISFYVSTLSKQPAFAMLYNFLGAFISRVIIAGVFFYSGMFFLVFFFAFTPDSNVMNIRGEEILAVLLYSCIAIPVSSFFIEWLPTLGATMMAFEADPLEHLLLYMAILSAGGTTYIAIPLLMIRTLATSTVRRLQRRER